MLELLGSIIRFILSWYVWMPTVTILLYLTWRNYQKINNQISEDTAESVLLILEIPKTNDKSELAAEQLFASLHGILRDSTLIDAGVAQEHLSFEIASVNGQITFYVCVPKTLRNFVEGQIYAQYPSVQIKAINSDYAANINKPVIHTAEIGLNESEFLPIRTFNGFEVDPLAGITGTLAKLEDTDEELWIQILTRPIADSWHKQSEDWVKMNIKNKKTKFSLDIKWFIMVLGALVRPPESGEAAKEPELSERDKLHISEAEKKAAKLGYKVKIRVAYIGTNEDHARLRMQSLVGTFKQFNSTNLNGFQMIKSSFDRDKITAYQARSFDDDGFILNIEELASVYHLPHTNVETPNIVWALSKTAEPPAKLPTVNPNAAPNPAVSAFGMTDFRGVQHQFGILRKDRSRHLYIIGQTGAGKSGTLELLALSDIYHNQGYAIIDPHGDFAIDNLKFIPERRIRDVVYFNPADTNFPLGFNPMEITNPSQRLTVSSEIIGVLKRMFGNSWGPRLEHILRYTILALLERPETTILDITRMLTDKEFRKETLNYVTDTVVLQFWKLEFASWNEKYATEAIAPVLNKVGAFTANPIIRNIIGQPKSTFNIRQLMDDGKILVVNLSKGLIGEDNAGILGAFLVTKIQLAAMSRSDIPNIADRRPFYLYVDEFQNFATDSFATILSEARKYALNLTVANQYIAQMSDEVRTAVFGNVGSIIAFRVSADDAPLLVKQFEPQFEATDLVNMHNRHFVTSMIINGEKQSAFTASTLTLPEAKQSFLDQIIEYSRSHYGRPRAEVEAEISQVMCIPEQFDTPSRQRFREGIDGKTSKETLDLRKIKPSQNEPKTEKPTDYRQMNSNALKEIRTMFDNFGMSQAHSTTTQHQQHQLEQGTKVDHNNKIDSSVNTPVTKKRRRPRKKPTANKIRE
ncbi:MAG: type IV secretion system DNA-binding domain-containing protein [Candidatus Saccharibacteria bacterium]|nr:type IV secretion system DNA-binding domain-containing protein [Candidatus Saccharibacteria bacterium]